MAQDSIFRHIFLETDSLRSGSASTRRTAWRPRWTTSRAGASEAPWCGPSTWTTLSAPAGKESGLCSPPSTGASGVRVSLVFPNEKFSKTRMFLSALLTDDASEEVIVEADEKPSSPPVPPPQRPPQDVVVIDTEEQNRPEYPVIPPVTGEIRFAFPENETWPICLILVSFLAQLLVFRTAGEQRRLHLLHLHSLQPQREVTHPVSSHNFHSKRENKNRLSSTTCGEELQKIFKDWQSSKELC